WEVFIRTRSGMPHKHCGSVHAADATMALQAARDVYTRRGEAVSIWVVPSRAITASDPADKDQLFEPTGDKPYRHPTYYQVPDEAGHRGGGPGAAGRRGEQRARKGRCSRTHSWQAPRSARRRRSLPPSWAWPTTPWCSATASPSGRVAARR